MSTKREGLVLPNSLLILLHLHLLRYPFVNQPQYDENMFNPKRRGIRERMKLTEDIIFFIAEKIEGNAKTILSSYPCLQPPDSTAFRTSAFRWLERLRNSSVRESSIRPLGPSVTLRPSMKGRDDMDAGRNQNAETWWWKEVVVRKSLLEECAGDRFERLLLSLSTHALMKAMSTMDCPTVEVSCETLQVKEYCLQSSSFSYFLSLFADRRIGVNLTQTLLQDQRQAYMTALTRARYERTAWDRVATTLLHRQDDLGLIKERLAGLGGADFDKHASLSLDRLCSLRDSKLSDLLNMYWKGEEGSAAFNGLMDLLDMKRDPISSRLTRSAGRGISANEVTKAEEEASTRIEDLSPPLLPVAAAHHPSHITRLQRRLFRSSSAISDISRPRAKQDPDHKLATTAQVSSRPKEVATVGKLEDQSRVQQALHDSLSEARRVGLELNLKLKEMKRTNVPTRSAYKESNLHLPVYTKSSETVEVSGQDYITERYKPMALSSLDQRVKAIRSSLFDSITTGSTAKKSSLAASASLSKLNIEETHNFPGYPSDEVKTPRRLLTSTTPSTVKPRSMYDRRAAPSRPSEIQMHGRRRSRKIPRKSVHILSRPSLGARRAISVVEIAERSGFDEMCREVADGVVDSSYTSLHQTRMVAVSSQASQKWKGASTMHASPTLSFKHVAITSPEPPEQPNDWVDEDDANGSFDDGRSMTLRDILLRAGEGRSQDDITDAILVGLDASAEWDY